MLDYDFEHLRSIIRAFLSRFHRKAKKKERKQTPDLNGFISKADFDKPLFHGTFEERVLWEQQQSGDITASERNADYQATERRRQQEERALACP